MSTDRCRVYLSDKDVLLAVGVNGFGWDNICKKYMLNMYKKVRKYNDIQNKKKKHFEITDVTFT